MTPNEIVAIQTVETVAALLSVGGCLTVLSRFSSPGTVWNITNKQLAILCSIDLVTAIFWGIGHAGQGNEGFCTFQAFMIQWGALANICWNSAIALHLYHWIALKKNESKISKKLRKTAIASICGPLFLSLILLASGVYGPADVWCWISADFEWVRFVCFYMLLLVAWLYNAYILKSVSDAVSSRVTSKDRDKKVKNGLFTTEAGIQQKLRQYVIVFVLAWFFGLLNRIAEACAGEPVFITQLLHAFFVPLQGFMNACCYGGIAGQLSKVAKKIQGAVVDETTRKRNPSSDNLVSAMVPYSPKQVSIFVSSFNQGEGTIEELTEDIPGWLLEGHDMYVIGLQECLCLEDFRAAMHAHLGGEQAFTMHTCEIGSNNTRLGFHGFIALTVFVRTEDIRNGFIKMTESSANDLASGTDLIVTTAANKGAVGLPFQIHDTSIGFVTAHLPSDSKGKSKLPKRNAAAQSMLREVVLASEDVGGDMQYLHDHLVVLGDLNYRMNPPGGSTGAGSGQTALSSIAIASAVEMAAMGNDPNWFRRKYDLFYGPKSPKALSPEHRTVIAEAARSAAVEWDVVLACDEMMEMMSLGEVFYGFKEVPPRFPPTYKRKKGIAGDCRDYSSVQDLISGYSHTGEEGKEGDLDDSRHSISSASESEVDSSSHSASPTIAPFDIESGGGTGAPVEGVSPAEAEEGEGAARLSSLPDGLPLTTQAVQKQAKKSARRSSMFSMRRGSILATTPEKEEEKKKSKLRPPSYTDRVIVHSLVEDSKLMPTAYGFCDSVRGSDHRPVCMALLLEVNSNILPSKPVTTESSPAAAGAPQILTANSTDSSDLNNPYVMLMSLNISNLAAVLSEKDAVVNPMLAVAPSRLNSSQKNLMGSINESDDATDGDEESPGSGQAVPNNSSPARSSVRSQRSSSMKSGTLPVVSEVLITFPLPGKDPLLEYRKMYDFAQAFNVDDDTSGFFKVSQHRHNKKLKEELLKPKRNFTWTSATSSHVEIDSCVDVSLGVDALLKLVDQNGDDMGQACISLTHLLQQERLGVPYSVEVALSSGGQYRGTLSGDFVLKHIPATISLG